ncbi:MAG: NFYB/HAP3 family transcription factor subunit [Candidatus Micrarchaeota archaeon]|nr:NFYB/HAP3 family transcription factor subunit [Candidatus Micrarchaeota archaeon]MDE1847967.1 NFYB/HAP3 family transcription factor subunit [Candidatus Micrarchaeota archaeon]MDE1864690.1 NFYB/HAP3 family transcription factor subunit [Candidatus Micrarchaeota archaeon]
MAKRGFSLYDIEQFMREAGAEQVTEDAVEDLERELERITEKLAERALKYAKHAGRSKLIRRSDVALVEHGIV